MKAFTDIHEPGAKDDGDKPMADLLLGFGLALEDVARLATFGAKKYSRGGWQHVENAEERYTAAMIRHLLKIENEEVDPETGLLHLTAVAWNALAALELKLRSESENLSWCTEEDLEEFRHLKEAHPWARWEAVDVGGDVYWYEFMPYFLQDEKKWGDAIGRVEYIQTIQDFDEDPAYTLIEIR